MLYPSKIIDTNKVCVNSSEQIINPNAAPLFIKNPRWNGYGYLRKADFAKIPAFVVCYFAITCCPLNSIGDYNVKYQKK